jgi:predicted signal transduction protein with EAL and GGDEF domain
MTTVDTGGRSPAIMRSIIGLCHSLGLQVPAEGVERPAQLGVLLTDRGVQIQGYLVSRPINAATVPVFLDQARTHLEQLMIAAPAPTQESDSNTTRLRTLRASTARGARSARSPADEK